MDALSAIDVFSMKVFFFFFQNRPRDGTLEELFFFFSNFVPCACIHAPMYAFLMKRQKANSLENITWSELGKQNVQGKKVYCQLLVCNVACVTYAI